MNDGNYTMHMIYMYQDTPCTDIYIDFLDQKIKIENHTDDMINRAFGVIESPTWDDFEFFLKDRCYEETRGDLKQILADLEIDSFDPLQIIEKTKGRCYEDDMWIDIRYITGSEQIE